MFADLVEWLQSMATVTPDQQLSFQDAPLLDGTVRGSQLETLADRWMQSFAIQEFRHVTGPFVMCSCVCQILKTGDIRNTATSSSIFE